jgi:hypothetical protein
LLAALKPLLQFEMNIVASSSLSNIACIRCLKK